MDCFPPRSLRGPRSEEHTSELQSQSNLVCRLLLEKKKKRKRTPGRRTGNGADTGSRPGWSHTGSCCREVPWLRPPVRSPSCILSFFFFLNNRPPPKSPPFPPPAPFRS